LKIYHENFVKKKEVARNLGFRNYFVGGLVYSAFVAMLLAISLAFECLPTQIAFNFVGGIDYFNIVVLCGFEKGKVAASV